jgi:hypothetical protein
MKTTTFRGQLADGGQDRIKLSTLKGKVGYRIKKFQIITDTPGASNYESLVKVFNTKQSSVTEIVNFEDQTMIAMAYQAGSSDSTVYPTTEVVIFDGATFNQDIYVTHADIRHGSGSACNYYIELEMLSLSDLEATYHTLQSIKTLVEE